MRAFPNTWTRTRVFQGIKVGISPRHGHGLFAGVVPRYATSVIGCVLALIATKQLWIYIQPTPSPMFIVAIVFISWWSGFGPGMFASLLATLLIDYYFVGPPNSLTLAEDDIVRFISFVVVTTAVSGLDAARRKNKDALRVENVYLELLLEITGGLNESESTEKVVKLCLDRICNAAGCPVGHAYLHLKPGTSSLNTEFWHVDNAEQFDGFVEATRKMAALPGGSLPNWVFQHRKSVWINDVSKNRLFTRARQAQRSGIKTALACPILNGSDVLGVMEFFSNEGKKPDRKLIEVLSLIGVQLGHVIAAANERRSFPSGSSAREVN
jgi:Domain of unknown function (DUF4118)/GAF domain